MDQNQDRQAVERERVTDSAHVPILEQQPGGEGTKPVGSSAQISNAEVLGELKRGERYMIWLTGAIALFALGSMIASITQCAVMNNQARIMRGQLDSMNETGRDTHTLAAKASEQAGDMKTLADQTTTLAQQMTQLAASSKTSAEAAKSMNRTALTAQVICQPPISTAQSSMAIGATWHVTVEIFNQYDRPAASVSADAAAIVTERGRSIPFARFKEHIINDVAIPRMDGLRAPKQLTFTYVRTGRDIGPVTNELFEAVRAGVVQLAVYGEMTYSDAAGCHGQEFCYRFDPFLQPNGNWTICGTHNRETACRSEN